MQIKFKGIWIVATVPIVLAILAAVAQVVIHFTQ